MKTIITKKIFNNLFPSKLWDNVCQLLATGRWFSPGTPVSSINKTDRHDITEILLKVALNTINLNQAYKMSNYIRGKNIF
jgi:hypothetical protein